MARSKRWIVTLAEGAEVGDVSPRLSAAGFEIDEVLQEIGVVTGRGEDSVARELRRLSGVEDVSEEGEIGVAPPDSDVW